MKKVTVKQRKTQMKRKQSITLIVMFCVLLFALTSYAWYHFKADKEVDSELADVMAPYYLYLIDDEGASLSLTIGSLHPGETKNVIIGVSNKPAGDNDAGYLVGKDSEFAYQMVLAYTQNLPITYNVYELRETEEASKEFSVEDPETGDIIHLKKIPVAKAETESAALTEANNQEMYGDGADSVVNYVQYDMYSADGDNVPLVLKTEVKDVTTSYELDYYLVEMNWADGIEFQDFIKETDLIYVIVDAVQPEPEVEN